jgi:transglutaminase-like putative cysteine protease
VNLNISHTTCYTYDRPVEFQPHLLYLRPRENPLLKVERFDLIMSPTGTISWMRDDFDNLPASVQFAMEAPELKIRSECLVTTLDAAPFDFLVRDYARDFPFEYEPLHQFNLAIYLSKPPSEVQAALQAWLRSRFVKPPSDTVGWVFALNQAINQSLVYRRRDEPGIQSPLETIGHNSGSCRDYASLLVACARTLGLAARFVSGYAYDANLDPRLTGDMHAWVEIFLPGAGWRGVDPTYGIFCHNAYVPVAHAVVAESINPIQGSYFSAQPATAELSIDVRIAPVFGS